MLKQGMDTSDTFWSMLILVYSLPRSISFCLVADVCDHCFLNSVHKFESKEKSGVGGGGDTLSQNVHFNMHYIFQDEDMVKCAELQILRNDCTLYVFVEEGD